MRTDRGQRVYHHLEAAFSGGGKTNFSATIGSALYEVVQPGLITVSLCQEPNKMRVNTYDPSGKPAPRPFHIAAFRD